MRINGMRPPARQTASAVPLQSHQALDISRNISVLAISVLAGLAVGRARIFARSGETPMASAKHEFDKEYDDIPGTYVFDADRSRRGYHLNMFCMSLMKAENRKAFKADEAGYIEKNFPQLTAEQKDAILKRQYNRMLELGGNIYFTAKLGATDGHPFQHLAAVMTGSTQQDYANLMLRGGRTVEGNRSRSGKYAKAGSTIVKAEKPKAKSKAKPKGKKRG
jgi:protocatechuate 4,5-dioxygenase alpha chain